MTSPVHQRVIDRSKAESHDAYQAEQAQKKAAEATSEHEANVAQMLETIRAQKPAPNTHWDDAQKHYEQARQVTITVNHSLAEELVRYQADPARQAKCKNPDRLAKLIYQLGTDTGNYLSEIAGVYSRHATKTGGTTTGDEFMEAMEIEDSYHSLGSVYATNAQPLAAEIMELIGVTDQLIAHMEAAVAQQVEERKAKAQDPTVITDIDVVEVKTGE